MDKDKELLKEAEEYREKIIDIINDMELYKLKFYYKLISGIEEERKNRS